LGPAIGALTYPLVKNFAMWETLEAMGFGLWATPCA
jgi:hypothetical protein